MSLQIPKYFEKLLKTNASKEALVLNAVRAATPWLTPNNLYFFPEYTEHGFTHLNEVLLSSSGLLTDEARLLLSAEDVAAITLSTVLHDCAMHLTADGFYTLIEGRYPQVKSRFLEIEESWKVAWESFFDEAKKFSSKKLIAMFGTSAPVGQIPKDKMSLTERDKLLIGEFIRRNHARLAHEIALVGIPGVNGYTEKLFTNHVDEHFMDLCGFIARSHNMGLREAVDCFESPKKRLHLKVHSPFIMLLLRISDYIQIHSERAEKQLLNIKQIVSPISQGEWKKHHAIVEIIHAHEDPEAIFIDAEPEDAKTYVGLKKLFSEIQSELDRCWSVLGEIYGRYEEFRDLGINIRRVRSTLDDERKYIEVKKPEFIPHLLSFRTASAEMMELLVAPLYGDKPAIGIRELLQNSVDACKELKDAQIKQIVTTSPLDDIADISIILTMEEGKPDILQVKDQGIGMTLDIVGDYFLNVGASFRNSDYWRKNHINDGRSTVHRTGRFGIGLLAAYLLGETLQVTTRHATQSSDKALSFTCNRGDTEIVVDHVCAEIGTTITIELNPGVAKKLMHFHSEWDWYGHNDLTIERKIVKNGNVREFKQKFSLPTSNEELSDGWSRTVHDEFDDILWRYRSASKDYYAAGFLFCNGIFITEHVSGISFPISPGLPYLTCYTPDMVIFDQDGKLPLNLERDSLNGTYLPFMHELSIDLSYRLAKKIGELLAPHKEGITTALISETIQPNIEGLRSIYNYTFLFSRFLLTQDKAIPMDLDLISRNRPNVIIADAPMNYEHGAWNTPSLKDCSEYFWPLVVDTNGKGKRANWVRTLFELDNVYYKSISRLPIVGRRILISKSEEERLVSPSYIPITFWRKLNKEWESDSWVMYCIGKVDKFDGDLDIITEHFEKTKQFSFIQYYLDWNGNDWNKSFENKDKYFSDAWDKIYDTPYILLK
ncbi:ATP-binding protein [Vibrio fluvialis]|uniref:HD domain-containing protein n=1 Tax=Vibrio fluvialis TaxID=676 RepID=UPI001F197F46|nr:ATP-binding protein [Vibrio fluvialis]MCE7615548.1 ATP-binding protein [Vibrio fluvialis]